LEIGHGDYDTSRKGGGSHGVERKLKESALMLAKSDPVLDHASRGVRTVKRSAI
jgi:hypothetical protein